MEDFVVQFPTVAALLVDDHTDISDSRWQVLSIMRDLVGQERSVSTDVERIVTDSAKNWLESIRETETSLGRILGAGSELEKQREQLKNLVRS